MSANTNFQIKVTLSEANSIRDALVSRLSELMKLIETAGGPANAPGTANEVGRVETLLRRDFGYEGARTGVRV